MAKQALFYEKVAPVFPQRHSGWSVEGTNDYSFAKDALYVPLLAAEILQAAKEYTVVFAGSGEATVPCALLGFQQTGNLYVAEDGAWDAKYIPAFVRRYPFIFSATEDESKFTLCIDEEWAGFNQESKGQPLFDEDGEKTDVIDRALKFNEEYHKSSAQTKFFCKNLLELELLESRRVDLTIGEEKLALGGFMIVNRNKLQEVPGEKLSAMAKSGELDLIYAHLLSMQNLPLIGGRIAKRKAAEPAATPKSVADQEPAEDDMSETPTNSEGIAS